MQILDHLLISCMGTGRHKSSKWAGTFCCHCTEKQMLTATLHVLLPLQWGGCSARPWGCGAREAAMTHIWGWVGYLFYNESFPLLLEKCHKSAFEAQKQCLPCTSTWPRSHNAVLLVSVLVHQKDRIMVLASFFPYGAARKWGLCSWKDKLRTSALEDQADTARAPWNNFRSL